MKNMKADILDFVASIKSKSECVICYGASIQLAIKYPFLSHFSHYTSGGIFE